MGFERVGHVGNVGLRADPPGMGFISASTFTRHTCAERACTTALGRARRPTIC